MNDVSDWSVDRLAANNLLANLKLEATADNLDMATKHFAQHRQNALGWASERAHNYVIRKLETASMTFFVQHSAEWSEGFRCAEREIATTTPEELLELGAEQTRTKGQILRGLMRRARSQ